MPPAVYIFAVRTALASVVVSSCDLELWSMTLSSKLYLERVRLNHLAKCILQMSFCSKVIVRTHTHTTDRLHYTATKVVGNRASVMTNSYRNYTSRENVLRFWLDCSLCSCATFDHAAVTCSVPVTSNCNGRPDGYWHVNTLPPVPHRDAIRTDSSS